MAQRGRRKSTRRSRQPARLEELCIESFGARGDGVARSNNNPVYVPFAAPGDIIRARVIEGRGEIDALLKPSLARKAPECSHFGVCGGCAAQHLDDVTYINWKWALVADALAREQFDRSLVRQVIRCATATRRRARFSVHKSKEKMILGFARRKSHIIEDIAHCAVLHPRVRGAMSALKQIAAFVPLTSFAIAVTACDNGLDVDIDAPNLAALSPDAIGRIADTVPKAQIQRIALNGDPLLEFAPPIIRFGEVQVIPTSGGFLQASEMGERALVDLVSGAIGDARRVVDLFCGSGTFSLPLAGRAAIDAFDADAAAVGALDAAARRANFQWPLTAKMRNLFDRPLSPAELKPYDAAIFDPPRAGAAMQAAALAESSVPRVIGVSCNPATFARDAAILRGGGYALRQVTPVDQFVYAAHIELVGLFERE